MSENVYIRTAADAKKQIGKQVWWEEDARRAWVLRTGILDDVHGSEVMIDGDWKQRKYLTNLRTFKDGGAFKPGYQAY